LRFASLKRAYILSVVFAGILIPVSSVGVRILQDPIKPWMHREEWSDIVAQDPYFGNTTLIVRGVIIDVALNRTMFGYMSYHTFPALITLNLTEVIWVDSGVWRARNKTVISVGYDFAETPNVTVGGSYEVRGFWLSITDSAYSYTLVVAPSVKGSYIKPL